MRNDNLSRVITPCNCKYGAPMGRANVGTQPDLECVTRAANRPKIYDKRVALINGGYDKGGAYWGIGKELRVRFTPDLSYIEFYRVK